ncbi:MAG: SDR family oxidoreductase [Chloroflexota bacterium]|nr:SDR family oxidoreductase [Dehalococcoidia bacterium]MDW8254578.1 SDR family oxidoreductase [Chloroflexota bacterium]
MDLQLAGKIALVTGASRGIGKAIALGLAAEGAHVALVARGGDALRQAAAEGARWGVRTLPIEGDVTVPADLERIVSRTASELGGIDVVVACAGGARHLPAIEATDADWQDGIARNLLHVARLARLVYPYLRRGPGRMIVIASIWGREAGGSVIYNAVKAAEISLAAMLAREWAKDGIGVVALCPGSIIFPGGSWERRQRDDPEGIAAFLRQEIPMGRFGTPEEVADVAVFLASPRARWVTATTVVVDGGQSRSLH